MFEEKETTCLVLVLKLTNPLPTLSVFIEENVFYIVPKNNKIERGGLIKIEKICVSRSHQQLKLLGQEIFFCVRKME